MKLTTQIFKLMVLLQPLLLYATVFKVTILVQLISDFILIGSFVQLFTVLGNRKNNTVDKTTIILAISIIVIAFLSLYTGGFSYAGLIAYLMFVSMLATWVVYPFINADELKKVCKYSFLLQALLVVYLSRLSFAYDIVEDDMVITSDMLTLGFNNPNLTSMIVFYVFVAILMYFKDEKNFLVKIFYFILLCYLFYLIYQTDCRTTLFMLVFLIVSFFLTSRNKILSSFMKKKIITIATLAFPILFGLSYVYFSHLPEYRDIELLGKPLFSGRQTLFVDFYKTLSENPIIGLCGRYKFANAHNGMLTILLNTGFIGLILYIIYTYRNLRSLSNTIIKPNDVLYLIAIIAVYISSSVESAMIVAGNLFYVYLMYLLVATRRNTIQ